jgi:BASS family bile acid:Na+ symporter
MTIAVIVPLAINVSLALTVLSVGLQATPGDAHWLFRHPALLVRSLLSMNLIMPLIALYVAIGFDLHPSVKLALIALALSPVPPFLPNKQIKLGGATSYAVGLLAAASLLSILLVPASVYMLAAVLETPVRMSPRVVAVLVGKTVLLPLTIGLLVRRVAPALSAGVAKPIAMIGTIMLTIAAIPLLIGAWPAVKLLLGNGTLVAIMLVAIAGLGVGHALGGPAIEDRLVLALSTASRHPAVAIAIAQATFPGEKLVTAAVLLELVVVTLVSAPYISHIKREVRERSAGNSQTRLGSARTTYLVDRRARR